MYSLRQTIKNAEQNHVAVGHFNISNIEGLWGIFFAARSLNVPVIIGLSEGERDFVGVRQAVALVKSIRDEYRYPIFINADHTYSFERVKLAVDAGFDAVIFDGAKLTIEENIAQTKRCVEYAHAVNPEIIVEAEMGYIGTSSKILDAIPEGAVVSGDALTSPDDAARFVQETGVDLFAPAVGNIHGMLRSMPDPRLDIPRIAAIRAAAGVPLVLHGGSGTVDKDFVDAITAGIAIVHINTEIRVAYRNAMRDFMQDNPDEIAPYKIGKNAVEAVQHVVEKRLALFNKKSP
ncbi:MAG: class II fructose-bisphosphate aldolase [Minisyncoccota bacterium]